MKLFKRIKNLSKQKTEPDGDIPAQKDVDRVIDSLSADDRKTSAKMDPESEPEQKLQTKIKHLRSLIRKINNKEAPADTFDLTRAFKIQYQDSLNEAQLKAVSIIDKPLLVIAGAGSGKTRVIIYKVAYLIENGINPRNILLLTFTRKAAEEMLSRTRQLLADKSKTEVIGGTFHSFANNTLRQYHKLIDIPHNFTISDGVDAADIIGMLKSELFSNRQLKKPFPRKTVIREIISKGRNLEIPISEVIDQYFSSWRDSGEEIKTISTAFTEYKKRNNILDYDDLIEVLKNKLENNETFRQKLQARIHYLLVDEYQDVNNCQRRIVELIVGDRNTVTVVGDDAQSIYSFRGANYENILSFPDSFANFESVRLEENYRSNQGVLSFVNEIISHAVLSFRKSLYTDRTSSSRPVIKQLADNQQEASYIANKILEIKAGNSNLDYSNFAVLARANWHSNFIQTELSKRQIPFVVRGGIKFVERSHVKDVIAFLKIILNPLDAISWHRVLNLSDGIGKVRASQVVAAVRRNNGKARFDSFSKNSWHKNLKPYENFYKNVNPSVSPEEAIERIIVFYSDQLRKIHPEDHKVRLQDINSLKIMASRHLDLEKFLSDFALDPPSNLYQESILVNDDEKCVVVSTIHSAKGLEWHTVFLIHALDGLLPSHRSVGSIEAIEEERRLFYVATSRAMENLFVTLPVYVSGMNDYFSQPSRFIDEIDKRYYESI